MKDIPRFKNEEEERQFWAEHDSTEFVDWSKAKRGGSEVGQIRTARRQR